MQLRSTFIGLFVIVALCGGGLFALTSYFGRDAQMREAEIAYQAAHANQIATTQAAHAARVSGENEGAGTPSAATPAADAAYEEEPLSLDDWYADAGSNSEPFDPTPEDNSWLINDTQPFE